MYKEPLNIISYLLSVTAAIIAAYGVLWSF